MARKSSKTAVEITPATPAQAREWLLAHQDELPDTVKVSTMGKLSNAAKAYFTEKNQGRPVIAA